MLSDTGLGALLTSLGLASSLFKPYPLATDSQAVDPFLGDVAEIADVLGIPATDIQVSPLFGALETVEQNSINKLASDRSPPSDESPVAPNNAVSSSPMSLAAKPPSSDNVTSQDASCAVEPYISLTVLAPTFPPFDEARATVYRYRQQQGVNLGSWFVHEQWMTPSLFACASGKRASELDIASGWGSTASARAMLERHWDTFITAEDFAHLASIGINTVRLPIGYWNLGPLYCQQTPFETVAAVYQNSWAHVVRVINMAADVDIGILVDLHGAVGSQNGQAHSGISDGNTNFFTTPGYQDKTIEVLTFLTQQLATVTNVVGIEILNEPQNVPELSDFYTRALTTLREVSPEAAKLPFYIHDGFDLQRFSDYVSARTDFVVQDHHSYFVFTPKDDAESADDHTNDIAGSIAQSLATAAQKQRNNLVVDEWSCALTADSLANEPDPVAARRRFCTGQMQVYQNATAGWSFWSYNKEGCETDGGWCFKHAVGQFLPATFFSYSARGGPGPAVTSALTKMQLPDLPEILGRTAQADSAALLDNLSAGLGTSPQKRDHRFAAVHVRRQSPGRPALFGPTAFPTLSVAQHAAVKGYADGFLTAKVFAVYGLSRLGFTGQYIEDSLRALGPDVVVPGNEDYYREAFLRGLGDAEGVVRDVVLREE